MFRYRSQAIFVVCADRGALRRIGAFRADSLASARTLTGIDVYDVHELRAFRGKRVGLITNQTGVDSQGIAPSTCLPAAHDVKLVALFSPEHGISGKADAAVADASDAASGVPIYSLYGETRRPTDEMLKGIDVLVFDVQDAGVRFYTYITTMAYCMEAAAKHHIRFVVFDRPNPLGGEVIEGPMLDCRSHILHRIFPDARALRHDAGRARGDVQRGKQDRRGP